MTIRLSFCFLALLAMLGGSCRRQPPALIKPERMTLRGVVWYEGTLESRNAREITTASVGASTLVELIPEGTRVKKGDVLARFDAAPVELELLKLQRDVALARAELQSLEFAKIPLEEKELLWGLERARADRAAEEEYLRDLRILVAENLMSTQEIQQQEARVAAAKATEEKLELQLDLTRRYLHPMALERARATLDSAERELAMAQARLSNCVIRAPADGMVVYKPVYVGSEFRPVRVGDTLFRNQAFLALPDMSAPVVWFDVPEAELSLIKVGAPAVVVPAAYPDLEMRAHVESVASMAQSSPFKPAWQKFFRVAVALQETDERLRAGMTVRVAVETFSVSNALCLPRHALRWDDHAVWCEVWTGRRRERRELQIGMANDRHVEILDGLAEHEHVIPP